MPYEHVPSLPFPLPHLGGRLLGEASQLISWRSQPIRLGLLSPGCSSWPAGTSTRVEQLLGPQGNDPAPTAGGSHPGEVLPPLLLPGHKL